MSTVPGAAESLVYTESILNSLREALLVLDEAYLVRTANSAFYETFQVSEAETLGKYLFELAKEQWDIPELRTLLEDISRRGTAFHDFEVEHDFPHLGRKILLLNGRLLEQKESAPRRILLVIQDVTERKRMEAELRLLQAELEERVRRRTAELASVNQELEAFAYSVSHDLRTPLRAISGFSKALIEDYADALGDEGRDFLDRVRGASQQMSDLIDDLLDLSRLTRAEMQYAQVDLSERARRIAEELQQADPSRNVAWEIQEHLTAVGDPTLIHTALHNLLENAWKYSRRNPRACISVTAAAAEGGTVYAVSDNGVGFDMAYSGKLFMPFQRLHSAHEFEGNGIGLATVARVIKRHGGTVWAESVPGRGATFRFTLPTSL